MLLIIFTIFVAVVSLLVALVTWLKNPKSALNRWLFIFILSGATWVALVDSQGLFDGGFGLWLLRLAFTAAIFMGYAALNFSRTVCRVRVPKKWLILEASIFSIFLVISLSHLVIGSYVSGVSIGFVHPSGSLRPERGVGYPLVVLFILYTLVLSIATLARQRSKSKGRQRSQISLILAGISLGSGVGITTNVILPNILHNTFPSRFAFVAVLLWTTLLVYAVIKHRFLDIRLTIVRAVAYVLSLLTILFIYSLLITLAAQFLFRDTLGAVQLLHTYLYGMVIATFTAFTFQAIRNFFDRATKRVFYRDAYDTKDVLDKISSMLVSVVGVGKVASQTLALLSRAIKPSAAAVVILEGAHREPRVLASGKFEGDLADLVNELEKSSTMITVLDELETPTSKLYLALQGAHVAVAARLKTSKERVGYLFFNYKASGNMYTNQDIDLIRIVADELAVALQNSLRFDEITHFNETLQKEIAAATEELQENNRKLKELDVAKNEFISMASHQLRTPLTSLRGYVSMALEGDEGELNAQQRRILREADDSARRLAYLINDFLNVSRLQTGKFTIEPAPLHLNKIITEEVSYLESGAKLRNIKLKLEVPSSFPVLKIDEDKIRQVVVNFVDNAIFYSNAGGVININLINTGSDAQFTVQDHGIGVPASERHKLFSKFYRASNARTKRPDGTGIGLFVAKKVILAHGGTLIFKTEEGKGSTFGFKLPLALVGLEDQKG